jgi:hypothetical protein
MRHWQDAMTGFTPAGITAGSPGTSIMSWFAPTKAGGMVATLQSIGAVGFSLWQLVFVGIFGAALALICR